MKNKPVIAIVGATGLVGSEMLSVLEQRKVPYSALRLLASQDSAGELYQAGGQEVAVEELDDSSFEGVNIALFATSAELSQKFVPIAVEHGAYVIDNSRHFRLDKAVPLIVPEVNPEQVNASTRIIANPNCSTIQLVPVLKAIHDSAGLKRVVVSTYQSVSGAGKAALDELWAQTLAICNQREVPVEEFPHQIAFNCIPHIDVIMDDGYTREEFKIIEESRKILGIPELRITATAVRIPVFHAHAESVNVETERELSPEALVAELEKLPGIEVFPNWSDYPMPLSAAANDTIQVGRIRRDKSVPHGLNLWIVADNVRKGAALNAVQIAELLIRHM